MDFKDLVSKRQSVRQYDPNRIVEEDKIVQIVEAGRLAPSACNSQPWTFVVVDEPELLKKLGKAAHATLIGINKFVADAPLIIAIVMENPKLTAKIGGAIKHKDFPLIDIGIAAEHLCLQAADLGIGSCMLGWFDEKEAKKLLHIPKNKTIALLISFGYEVENYRQRKKIRKSMDVVFKRNKYE